MALRRQKAEEGRKECIECFLDLLLGHLTLTFSTRVTLGKLVKRRYCFLTTYCLPYLMLGTLEKVFGSSLEH